MRLKSLRSAVLEANQELVRRVLILYAFGNARASIVRADWWPEDVVLTNLSGEIAEGDLRPSSDLATHLLLYRSFPGIGAVVHIHSEFATAWAQAGREIPAYGTVHADY